MRFFLWLGDTGRLPDRDLDLERLRDLPELRLRLRFAELARLPERLRLFDRDFDLDPDLERDLERDRDLDLEPDFRLPLRLRRCNYDQIIFFITCTIYS